MNKLKRAKFRLGRIKTLINQNLHNTDLVIDVDDKLGEIIKFIDEELK